MSYFQYSRKNFLFPEQQEFPHTSFDEEVKYTSQIFSDGHPYVFGPLSGEKHLLINALSKFPPKYVPFSPRVAPWFLMGCMHVTVAPLARLLACVPQMHALWACRPSLSVWPAFVCIYFRYAGTLLHEKWWIVIPAKRNITHPQLNSWGHACPFDCASVVHVLRYVCTVFGYFCDDNRALCILVCLLVQCLVWPALPSLMSDTCPLNQRCYKTQKNTRVYILKSMVHSLTGVAVPHSDSFVCVHILHATTHTVCVYTYTQGEMIITHHVSHMHNNMILQLTSCTPTEIDTPICTLDTPIYTIDTPICTIDTPICTLYTVLINSTCMCTAGDHWYVFIADRVDRRQEKGHTLDCDQTLNVYMYDIDPGVAQLFMKADPLIIPSILEGNNNDEVKDSALEKKISDLEKNGFASEFSTSAADATARSGISKIMPEGSVVHDYMFEPCGYSMNGRAPGGAYWTIHITPEAHCSYASFETNYQCESYAELLKRIVAVFKPGKLTTIEHIDKLSAAGKSSVPLTPARLEPFKLVGRTHTEFSDMAYCIQACNYKREVDNANGVNNGQIMYDN